MKAVKIQDLRLSLRVLSESLTNRSLNAFADELREYHDSSTTFNLAVRDHIAGFLDFWPVYFALKLPSHEILLKVSDLDSLVVARIKLLDFVRGLVEIKDDKIIFSQVDTQTASRGHYSLLLPSILERRTTLFDTFSIPFLSDSYRSRYFIGHLSSTSYGQDLLDTIGIPIDQLVIGEKKWTVLEKALNTFSITPSERLIEIDEQDWVKLINEFPGLGGKYSSGELQQVDSLWKSLRSLKSPDTETRSSALKAILETKSLTAVPQIAPLIREGPLFERYLVIEALSEVGGPEAESLLGDLLQDDDPVTRNKAARALAFFASKEFTTPADVFFKEQGLSQTAVKIKALAEEGVKESIDYLQVLSKHQSRYVKLEVVSTLKAMNSTRGNCILRDMQQDPDASIRLEIVKAAKSIERKDAYDLLKTAIQDCNPQVQSLAKEVAAELWPDEIG
jgi:hypothetical protein